MPNTGSDTNVSSRRSSSGSRRPAPAAVSAPRHVRFQINGEVLAPVPPPPEFSAGAYPRRPSAAGRGDGAGASADFAALRDLATQRAADMASLASELGFQVVRPPMPPAPPSPPPLPRSWAAEMASSPLSTDCPVFYTPSCGTAWSRPGAQRQPPFDFAASARSNTAATPLVFASSAMCETSCSSSNDASLFGNHAADDATPLPMLFPDDAPAREGDSDLDLIQFPTPLAGPSSETAWEAGGGDRLGLAESRSPSPQHVPAASNTWHASPFSSLLSFEGTVNYNPNAYLVLAGNSTNNEVTSFASAAGLVNHGNVTPAEGDERPPQRSPGTSNSEDSVYPLPDITVTINTRAASRMGPPSATTLAISAGEREWGSAETDSRTTREGPATTRSLPQLAAPWWQVGSPPPPPPPPPPLTPPPTRTPMPTRLSAHRFSTSLRDVLSPSTLSASATETTYVPLFHLSTPTDISPSLFLRDISSAETSCSFGLPALSALEPHAMGTA